MRQFCIILLLFIIIFPCKSKAACVTAALSGVPSTTSFQGATSGYEVFDSTEYMQSVTFQVTGSATLGACSFYVTLSTGQSGSFTNRTLVNGANSLNYNAYVSSGKTNVLKDNATATSSEVVAGSFSGLNQTVNVTFYWTITPSQVKPSAATPYTDTSLTISLYTGVLNLTSLLVDTETISFQTNVQSSVDLSLVDSGAVFNISDTSQTLDFGSLTTGEALSFDTVVRSNNGYVISMQSQNSQVLKHANAPTVTDTIGYSLSFNSSAKDLSGGGSVNVASGSGVTTSSGSNFPTTVTIGTATGKIAGTYSDIITTTVTAQ